jgi:hypothetical protein
MPNNPVQVILNTRDYFAAPDAGRFGPAKDFFDGRDIEFVEHRAKLLNEVASISSTFKQSGVSSGVVKVNLRREAWAKSHRPHRALFPPEKRPCIGVSRLGELFYHVTVDDLEELTQEITTAETETRRHVSRTGHEYTSPSDQRSDAGAVEAIRLPEAADKRRFSAQEALAWLENPATSGAYFVELFSPPANLLPQVIADYYARVISEVMVMAQQSQLHVEVFRVDLKASTRQRPLGIFGVRLVSETTGKLNRAIEDHGRLYHAFESHPYVRRVLLPPVVVAARVQTSAADAGDAVTMPLRVPGRIYPKVGVIDGGVADHLGEWRVGEHSVVAPEHRHLDHGTFIAGLLVGGQQLNSAAVCSEADGCEVFDVGIFPDSTKQFAFDAYYPRGIVDFLNELEAGVELAHRDHGVRVFNMSLNVMDPVQEDSYGVVASLLDGIADRHNVLFVISAGNLRTADCRAEWPAEAHLAVQQLAARTQGDTIFQPAESSRSLAVGALNPPGCIDRVEGAPTAYTRRGPGLRVGVKPDVGHFGGAMPDSASSSGLVSWVADGSLIHGHGTSYAAPLVAKSLATLDSRVASPLPREMLIGMLIHSCELPLPLQHETLGEVARQFSGFGVPKCTDEMLFTPEHAITLVFSDVLHARRVLEFDFAWPQSLVNAETGACRGEARLTLVYRPPLNRDFGTEFVRLNIDAHLRQEEDGGYLSRLKQAFLPDDPGEVHYEHELIQHGLKWWPVKVYRGRFPRGKGRSSNWRLSVESLLRAEEVFPAAGVPFSIILTLSDLRGTAPVFNDLRLHLTTRNVQIADIRTATQIRVQA